MASTSIAAFSIYAQSHSPFLNSKPLCYTLPNSPGHPLIHGPHKHIPILRNTLLSVFPTPIPTATPSSNFSAPTSDISSQKVLSKFFSEKIFFFLVGSFVFMGCFSKRTALAVAPPSVGSCGVLEEKVESKEGKSEEEKVESEEGESEEEKEKMYEKILEKDPRNVEALKVILFGKIRRGKSKEAVKFVESLINVEPNEVEWRLLLALCYETMGHLGKAKRLFKEILKKRPLLVRALHGLAMVMHKNNDGPAVFEVLNRAQELASRENKVTEERNIRILIAQMLVVQGDLEEGLKRFQDLVEENPRDFRPYLCQGIIYSLLDKKEEAAQQFEIYQALVPEEFPQRGFLDDVALTAKRTTREQFKKAFRDQFSNQK